MRNDRMGIAVIGAGMAGRSHAAGYRSATTCYGPGLPPVDRDAAKKNRFAVTLTTQFANGRPLVASRRSSGGIARSTRSMITWAAVGP